MLLSSTLLLLVAAADIPADQPVANFRLNDYLGTTHSLEDYAASKLIVVAFLGAECPLANRYAGRLAELERKYVRQGVTFLGIDSNQQDSLAQLAHLAKFHRIEFPLLKDPGNAVADRFGATRTPEVFVLDGKRVIRYRGRVDDQYGVGYSRPAPTRRDLGEALDELLAGKPVTRPVTEAAGCCLGRVQRQPAKGNITYSKQVARILQERCVGCHRTGAIAPFALTSYRDAAAWAETIREVVHDRRMPPWDASPKIGTFVNDPGMTEAERGLIEEWVKNGVPEGDAKDLPPPRQFAEGWRIPKPDLVVSMPKAFAVPAQGTVPYQYFTVNPGFKDDKWVRAAEVKPGNPSVVHHVVVIVHPPGKPSPADRGGMGEFVAVGVPGMSPVNYPEGHARLIPAGSKLVFQMHYTPNGTPQTDRSQVGLVFADPKSVWKQVKSDMALDTKFRIPAGEPDHVLRATYRFEQDAYIHALFPHMHLRGKAFRFEAAYPDGRREVLLDVPRYRFDWQNQYVLGTPKLMPEGTMLHCEGHYDNSAKNLSNPDPTRAVRFGEQTWDEMMVGYFDMALADQDLRFGLPRATKLDNGNYEVVFRYPAPPKTKEVYLAGEFNGWNPTGHKMDGPDADGKFTMRLELKAGRHEYKYVLEGKQWRRDPGNPRQAGKFDNSVIELPGKVD